MEPFKIPSSLKSLTKPYPCPKVLLDAAHSGGEPARIAFARLWLSEGIPHAFRCCPVIYESVRSWLSTRLGVHAKEISLVGSARLGKSLKPQKLGDPFRDNKSDLDIFIVSTHLFEALTEDFYRWSGDFKHRRIQPETKTQKKKYWPNNYERGPILINRGFMDQKMIPNYPQYPTTLKIGKTMDTLVKKLKVTLNAPKPKHASVRCYSSWDSFVQQVSLNLK